VLTGLSDAPAYPAQLDETSKVIRLFAEMGCGENVVGIVHCQAIGAVTNNADIVAPRCWRKHFSLPGRSSRNCSGMRVGCRNSTHRSGPIAASPAVVVPSYHWRPPRMLREV
jgi:hypothetical protein